MYMINLTKGLATSPFVDGFYVAACTFIHSWPSDFGQFFCRFFRLLVRLLDSCDLRSKHNMLGKSDVVQSENS